MSHRTLRSLMLTLAVVALSSSTGCQREADPALDLYIMPLYVVGMVPFAVSVGVRDIYAASRGSRVLSGVIAVVYVAAAVGLVMQGWPRSGVFAVLIAIASAVLAARPRKAS
jgi:hypothetical protein